MKRQIVGLRAILLLTVLLPVFGSIAHGAESSRPITHEDLWLMKRVGAPSVSPDGRWAVFAVTEPAYDEKAQVSDLWIVATTPSDTTPAAPRRLTGTAGGESGVDWSEDSRRLVFSARREGDETAQIYMLDLAAGGEALRLTREVNGARAPRFSPDGKRVAFVSADFPAAEKPADNQRIAAERKARKWNARVYDGFPIRNWDRWLDDLRPSLNVIELRDTGAAASEPRNLLIGTQLVAQPGYAAGGDEGIGYEWTPDGRALVFAASVDRHTAAYRFTSSQLWRVGIDGGEPQRLTDGVNSWAAPRFSPDGRVLLLRLSVRTDKAYNDTQLAAFDWGRAQAAGAVLGAPRVISAGVDRAVSSVAFAADSQTVYYTAEEAGHEKLFVTSVRQGKPRLAFEMERGVYTNISVATAAKRLVLVANFESATQPPEVVRVDLEKAGHQPLTAFNAERLAGLDLAPLRHFWFESSKSRRIHNMLLTPPGFDPAKKYPLFVVIHGGPHTMWRDQWVLRWNYHLLAAPGYVVLLTNYSGSTGFGEAAAQTIQGDPLRTPSEELNEAADEAIRLFPFIDAGRQCAGGASYGGHMANWLQATTSRYRCFISHAGLINLESQWGTSDTIYGREVNSLGPVWEQGPVWREQNPIRYAANFKTPTLVTIGERDFRVPLNNSLEYWSVLQRLQIPSRLVVFPDENHWILKGENSRFFYSEVHAWLARYLADDVQTAAD
jgi:dipeptidyl aminopeptidase/acylaminoacyl peptidase